MNASELISFANDQLAEIDRNLAAATERFGVLTVTLELRGLRDDLTILMQGRHFLDAAHSVGLKTASQALGAAGRAVAGQPDKPVPVVPKIDTPPSPPAAPPPIVVQVGGVVPSTQIDPHSLNEDDWNYYVRHPEVWNKVEAGPYTNARIQEVSAGTGGPKYNPSWDETAYQGRLK